MSVPAPVAGNQFFTVVDNVAGQISRLDVSDIEATSADVNLLNIDNQLTDATVVPYGQLTAAATTTTPAILKGSKRLYRVNGYAPSAVGTTAAAGGFFFNKYPQQVAATSATDTKLLTLPVGAEVIGLRLTNNGTTITSGGAATGQLLTSVWGAAPTAGTAMSGDIILASGATNLVNSNAGIDLGWPLSSYATLATAGGAAPTAAQVDTAVNGALAASIIGTGVGVATPGLTAVTTTTINKVGLLVSTAALTAGSFAVSVYYLLDE